MEPTISEINDTISEKRILLGHPTCQTKQRKINHFGSDRRFLIGLWGVLPYTVK